MKVITQARVNEILRLHEKWLDHDPEGQKADFYDLDLSGVNLNGRDLRMASMTHCNLSNVSFVDTNVELASFKDSDMTNVKGLPTQEEVLNEMFKKTKEGYIVYKIFNFWYAPPKYWKIEKGSVIEEKVDMDRRRNCSYGINVATFDWVEKEAKFYNVDIWECLLSFDDLDKVCVPYGTDGKIRCGRLKLLDKKIRDLENLFA